MRAGWLLHHPTERRASLRLCVSSVSAGLPDPGVEMEPHGRRPAGTDDHFLRLCPRQHDRGIGTRDDDVRSTRQPHFEATLGIGAERGDRSISLLHGEAGTEGRVTRHVDLADRLNRTAQDGPDQRRVAGRSRSTTTRCPAGQSHYEQGCGAHAANFSSCPRVERLRRYEGRGAGSSVVVRYTLFNDCYDQRTTGAQSALPLRLGPQIQTLLSREGRQTGSCRTGQSRGRCGRSIARNRHAAQTGTKTANAPALEGDHFSWLRSTLADAA